MKISKSLIWSTPCRGRGKSQGKERETQRNILCYTAIPSLPDSHFASWVECPTVSSGSLPSFKMETLTCTERKALLSFGRASPNELLPYHSHSPCIPDNCGVVSMNRTFLVNAWVRYRIIYHSKYGDDEDTGRKEN